MVKRQAAPEGYEYVLRRKLSPEAVDSMKRHGEALDALLVLASLKPGEPMPEEPAFASGLASCRRVGFVDGTTITEKGCAAYKRNRLQDLPGIKTKPAEIDLNAHPMADVLREVCAAREHVPADAILDPVDGALSECLNTAYDIEGDRHARLLRIARVAIAGLAVLAAEQKGSA